LGGRCPRTRTRRCSDAATTNAGRRLARCVRGILGSTAVEGYVAEHDGTHEGVIRVELFQLTLASGSFGDARSPRAAQPVTQPPPGLPSCRSSPSLDAPGESAHWFRRRFFSSSRRPCAALALRDRPAWAPTRPNWARSRVVRATASSGRSSRSLTTVRGRRKLFANGRTLSSGHHVVIGCPVVRSLVESRRRSTARTRARSA